MLALTILLPQDIERFRQYLDTLRGQNSEPQTISDIAEARWMGHGIQLNGLVPILLYCV